MIDDYHVPHRVFGQNFELTYTTPLEDAYHECPYPKPTAKLYGADKAGEAKTEWRNTWVEGSNMTAFQTEIKEFIEVMCVCVCIVHALYIC